MLHYVAAAAFLPLPLPLPLPFLFHFSARTIAAEALLILAALTQTDLLRYLPPLPFFELFALVIGKMCSDGK